ncbi:hypothetical protein M408DRAFT_33529, partial [Serendipita vermifera MAFF 305830]
KNRAAFAINGKLGTADVQIEIKLKEGAEPAAMRMYQQSPRNREVIEEQIKKWLAQEVIEPANSPWAAPVVIVQRNGKDRF